MTQKNKRKVKGYNDRNFSERNERQTEARQKALLKVQISWDGGISGR